MKNFIIIISLFSLTACSDFLTREPLSEITTSGLTYSASECKEYVNQFYDVLTGPFVHRDDGLAYDLGTDNLLSVSYQNNQDLIEDLRVVPASGGGWGTNEWGRIRTLNYLLDNYTKSPELVEAEKYIAEAHFFRAYLYFEQFLKKFGSVPWIKHAVYPTSEELYAVPLPRNELADKIIITSDNPRSEDPQQIITDILAGIKNVNDVIVEPDRELAIKEAHKIAQPNDVLLVAGKGHEDYQILAHETIHFDDREKVREIFG